MVKNITKLKHRLPKKFRDLLSTIRHLLTNHWLFFILLAFTSVLSFLNYQPGTTLTGWDNLHPEYNFAANIRRSLFAVWQEYQSLGLLGGHAHATDLLRQLFLYFLYTVGVPVDFQRYFWTFLMLALGPLGVYTYLHHFYLKHKFDDKTIHFASFLGGLFYLLNLSTVQHFFTPFETFTAYYGFFPWLIVALFFFLAKLTWPRFFTLFIINLLASPAYYTETMFVVYFLCVLIILTNFILTSRHRSPALAESLTALTAIGLANAYWLLPVIFFVITNGGVGLAAKINTIATPETYFRNLAFGNLPNLTILRGFWFDFLDLSGGGKFDYLMLSWRNHLDQPTILLLGFLLFVLVVTGAIYSFSKKIKSRHSLLGITLLCLFFLIGGGLLINRSLPILGELLRSPFTKFSTVLAFGYSVFFAIGCIFLLDLFSFLHSRLTYYLTLFTVTLALVIFMTPAFTGNLISPSMRLKVPDEYFQLFDFFKSQDPATRIANFPQYTFWGWNYYSWGYRGSGFLWYGIKQPILDRAFDVWERSSEKYYEEISTALYSEDQTEFENLIDKYAINWLLIDKNVIAPTENIDLGLEKLQRFLDNSDKFTLAKSIDDKIFIYKTNVDQTVKNFLSLSDQSQISQPKADPPLAENFKSQIFDLPLRPLTSQITDNQITLSYQLPATSYQLAIPSYSQSELLTPNAISYRKTPIGFQLKLEPILPIIKLDEKDITPVASPYILDFALPVSESGLILGINDQYLEVQLPDELTIQSSFYPLNDLYLPSQKPIRVSVYSNTPSQKLDLATPLSQAIPVQCYTDKPNRRIEKIIEGKTISLLGTDLVGCLTTSIPGTDLNHLISLEFSYQSSTGTPANASITNRALGGENSPQALLPKSETTFTRVFAKPLLEPMQANLILEANESKSTQEVTYQNPSVSYLPLLAESTFTLPPLPESKYQISQPKANPPLAENIKYQILSVSLPTIDNPLTVSVNLDQPNLNPEARNCDNFNTGEVDRLTTPDGLPTDRQGFLYTARNANSCDQINLKHLPHESNYAILADIETEKGLSPTICLENYSTRRCDVFERLIDGRQLIIQPISNRHDLPGYTLHLSNQSFGDRPTANLLKSLTVLPFPLEFLKSITLETTNFPSTRRGEEGTPLSGGGEVSSTHPIEFLYTASINNSQSTILNLYQTRSLSWKALEISEADLKLPLWQLTFKLPLLYLSKATNYQLPATSSPNWHNSWTLPPGDHHLVIFYLPQYLEFFGFFLLPLPFIAILIHILFIRKKVTSKK